MYNSSSHTALSEDKQNTTINIVSENLADGSINFYCDREYKISPENYAQWPKFESLILDKKNQQVISILFKFKNHPNFEPILKVCSLFDAVCEQREILKTSNQAIIGISHNSIPVITYLSNVYSNFSLEAGLLLDNILIYMIEDMLDKTTPSWKLDISLTIRSLQSDSPYTEDFNLSHINEYYKIITPSDDICPLPKKLDVAKEKLDFETMKAQHISENIRQMKILFAPKMIKEMAYYKKFATIENFFNTTSKCNDYLHKKNPDVKLFVEEMHNSLEQQLQKLFTPSALEQIANALLSDTSLKNAKSGNTLVGASTDLVVNAIQAAKNLPLVNVIFTTLTVAKVAVSSADLLKRNGVINKVGSFDANFAELSQSFACKVTICSLNNFTKLSPTGRKDLSEFYAKFIYTSITKDPHQYPSESYLASNLLEKLSNQNYVEKLELKKDLAISLEYTDNSSITISEYISGYNQTTCYADVLYDLMGEVTNRNDSNSI